MILPGLARRNAGIRMVVALCVLSGLGVLSVTVATRWGPGLTPDSAVYIGGASSLLAGKGFVMPTIDTESLPISLYLPLYPALLAMVSAFGTQPMAAARLLNAILFGANIFLVGVLVRRARTAAGPVSSWLGAFAALFVLILTSKTMLHVHVMTWSEPTFIFFWLLGVMALLAYQRTSQRSLLFVSAACGSLRS